MQQKSKIILTRRTQWLNRVRTYHVFIDGVEVGSIRDGASEEFVVTPGNHTIQCKIAWYGSPVFPVLVEPERIEYLVVKSGMRYYWFALILLIAGLFINLSYFRNMVERPFWVFIIKMVIVLPALLYFLYYLTFARKQYLLIEIDKENIFAS
ncbi:MAG: hypothetical protein C5B59_21100 [Bacteroidetes bacterium]|nr:MAG: hypothetical protein C5B59_21100 [Bacteroidota bacterium]